MPTRPDDGLDGPGRLRDASFGHWGNVSVIARCPIEGALASGSQQSALMSHDRIVNDGNDTTPQGSPSGASALRRKSPIAYLARWRMQLAAQVGYDSEAAFSRAFKAAVGLSPAAWRKDDGL